MAASLDDIASIIKRMQTFRMDGRHDVEIHVEEEKFYCHRHLMAAACPTLEPMLLKENWQSDVPRLNSVDPKLFKLIVEYVYSGVINITPDIALNLLKLADYLGMECLAKTCNTFLKSFCPLKDLLDAYEFGDFLKDADLIDALSAQIARRLGTWRSNKKLLSFSFERIESFLKKLKKLIDYEGDHFLLCCTLVPSKSVQGKCNVCGKKFKGPVYSHKAGVPPFILNWIRENVAERIGHFSVLCKYGELDNLHIDDLNNFFQLLRNEQSENVKRVNLVLNTTPVLHVMKTGEIQTLTKRIESDEWAVYSSFALSASRLKTASKARTVFYLSYNLADGIHKYWNGSDLLDVLRSPPLDVANYELTSANDIIYLYQYNCVDKSETTVCCYVEAKDRWFFEPCAPKLLHNSYFVSSKNTLYLVGGTSELEVAYPSEKFIQRYDPRTSKWDVIPIDVDVDLMLNGAACMYENEIYICSKVEQMGDHVDKKYKFYQFDTRIDKWRVDDVNVEDQFEPTVSLSFDNELWTFSKNLKDGVMIYDMAQNVWNKREMLLGDLEKMDEYKIIDGCVVKTF